MHEQKYKYTQRKTCIIMLNGYILGTYLDELGHPSMHLAAKANSFNRVSGVYEVQYYDMQLGHRVIIFDCARTHVFNRWTVLIFVISSMI